ARAGAPARVDAFATGVTTTGTKAPAGGATTKNAVAAHGAASRRWTRKSSVRSRGWAVRRATAAAGATGKMTTATPARVDRASTRSADVARGSTRMTKVGADCRGVSSARWIGRNDARWVAWVVAGVASGATTTTAT